MILSKKDFIPYNRLEGLLFPESEKQVFFLYFKHATETFFGGMLFFWYRCLRR